MSMTISQLKQELVNHGVPLPESSARKEVYEKLYQEFVVKSKGRKSPRKSARVAGDDFSSDEDNVSISNENGMEDSKNDDVQILDYIDPNVADAVGSLSNGQIYLELIQLGQNVGPVVASTREMYRKKLIRLKSQTGHVDTPNGLSEIGNISIKEQEESEEDLHQYSTDEEMDYPKTSLANTNFILLDNPNLTHTSKTLPPMVYSPRSSSFASTSTKSYTTTETFSRKLKMKNEKNLTGNRNSEEEEEPRQFSTKTLLLGIGLLLLAIYLAYELYGDLIIGQPNNDDLEV